MKRYNVLITGGLGLIGTFLVVKNLRQTKMLEILFVWIILENILVLKKKIIKDYRFLRSQLIGKKTNNRKRRSKILLSFIKNYIKKYKPKFVVHLAALPLAKLENLNSEEALEGSVISTTSIIETINAVTNSYEL